MASVYICQIDGACVGTIIESTMVDFYGTLHCGQIVRSGIHVDETTGPFCTSIESRVFERYAFHLNLRFFRIYTFSGICGSRSHMENAIVQSESVDVWRGLVCVVCTNVVTRAIAEFTIFDGDIVRTAAWFHANSLSATFDFDSLKREICYDDVVASCFDNRFCTISGLDS